MFFLKIERPVFNRTPVPNFLTIQTDAMNNKSQLPESLQKTLKEFYNNIMPPSSGDIVGVFDEIIQDALRGNDKVGGGEAADTFFIMKNVRDFIVNLQEYAQ